MTVVRLANTAPSTNLAVDYGYLKSQYYYRFTLIRENDLIGRGEEEAGLVSGSRQQ